MMRSQRKTLFARVNRSMIMLGLVCVLLRVGAGAQWWALPATTLNMITAFLLSLWLLTVVAWLLLLLLPARRIDCALDAVGTIAQAMAGVEPTAVGGGIAPQWQRRRISPGIAPNITRDMRLAPSGLTLVRRRQQQQQQPSGDCRIPTCAACSQKMTLHHSEDESIWRCSTAPGCEQRMAFPKGMPDFA